MEKYTSKNNSNTERENKLKHLEEVKEYCFTVYKEMQQHFDYCLKNKNYPLLLDLKYYFTKSDQNQDLYHTSETRRISILLDLLTSELNNGKPPFVSSTTDFKICMEQYTLTVFALRRIELALSEDAMTEAFIYLNSIPFNVYSAVALIENEYFENHRRLYLSLYQNITCWNTLDKIQWLTYWSKKYTDTHTLMELASLYLEINDLQSAYSYLNRIPSPTGDIINLMNLLKERL